jgi:hypothetical protein
MDLVLLPEEGFTQGSFTAFGRRRQGSVEINCDHAFDGSKLVGTSQRQVTENDLFATFVPSSRTGTPQRGFPTTRKVCQRYKRFSPRKKSGT